MTMNRYHFVTVGFVGHARSARVVRIPWVDSATKQGGIAQVAVHAATNLDFAGASTDSTEKHATKSQHIIDQRSPPHCTYF